MAKHRHMKTELSFQSDTIYRSSTFTWYIYYHRRHYSVYRIVAYGDSPGEVVGVQVYAPNPIEAYIAVLDMGYTPVGKLQYDLLW
jgi:predicted GNAT superfamily acetyltransferase